MNDLNTGHSIVSAEPFGCYEHTFTVRGSGVFPFDMLRKDEAFPRTEEDAKRAHMYEEPGFRRVTLVSRQPRRLWMPCIGRWESFGWRVVETPATSESAS